MQVNTDSSEYNRGRRKSRRAQHRDSIQWKKNKRQEAASGSRAWENSTAKRNSIRRMRTRQLWQDEQSKAEFIRAQQTRNRESREKVHQRSKLVHTDI